MRTSILYMLFIFMLVACEEYEIEKSIKSVKTFPVLDVDSTGLTLKGDVFGYSESEIISCGFQWHEYWRSPSDPYLETANLYSSIDIASTTISSLNFSARIDSLLNRDIEYVANAFVITEDTSIFGNDIRLLSQGSKHSNWNLFHPHLEAPRLSDPVSVSSGNNWYLLSEKGFYIFNPETRQLKELSLAFDLGEFNPFTSNGNIYFLHRKEVVYLFRYNGGVSILSSNVPVEPDEMLECSAFGIGDDLYILNREELLRYSINDNLWTKVTSIPQGFGFQEGIIQVDNTIYVITNEKYLLSYDFDSDSWEDMGTTPGFINNKSTCFHNKGKLYFVLIYKNNDPWKEFSDAALWSYDPNSTEWKIVEALPYRRPPYFHFQTDNALYIGYWISYYSSPYSEIWKCDLLNH